MITPSRPERGVTIREDVRELWRLCQGGQLEQSSQLCDVLVRPKSKAGFGIEFFHTKFPDKPEKQADRPLLEWARHREQLVRFGILSIGPDRAFLHSPQGEERVPWGGVPLIWV